MGKTTLRVYDRIPGITSLGPGRRYGLWVQGCRQSCPGCTTPKSRPLEGGQMIDTSALAWEIVISKVDGITISGGEPFLQASALADLLKKVRDLEDLGVIVYTGLIYEDLLKQEEYRDFLDKIDLLIDGPYIESLDDGGSDRGSSNQRAILLSDRYRSFAASFGQRKRETQTFRHGFYSIEVGIPSHGT